MNRIVFLLEEKSMENRGSSYRVGHHGGLGMSRSRSLQLTGSCSRRRRRGGSCAWMCA